MSEKVDTFAEAVAYLTAEDRSTENIDYEVRIEGHQGALMSATMWLEAVKQHFFIDYDGMGHQVSQDGKIIGDGYIYPSTANTILPETAYILWYNR